MKATLPNIKKLAGRGRTEKICRLRRHQQRDRNQRGGGGTQTAAAVVPVLHAVPPGGRRAGAAGRGEAGGDGGDGAGAGRTQARGLRWFPERTGLPGAIPWSASIRRYWRPCGATLTETQPSDLPQQTKDAADSLGRLLTGLEIPRGHPGPALLRRLRTRKDADEMRGLLARAGLGVFSLNGQALRLLLLASALGGSPNERE